MREIPKFEWEKTEHPDVRQVEHKLLERVIGKTGRPQQVAALRVYTAQTEPLAHVFLEFDHWLLGRLNVNAESNNGALEKFNQTFTSSHAPGWHTKLRYLPHFVSQRIIKSAAESKLKTALKIAPNKEVEAALDLPKSIEKAGWKSKPASKTSTTHEFRVRQPDGTIYVPIHLNAKNDLTYAEVANLAVEHPLGEIRLNATFENGKITQVKPTVEINKWRTLKSKLGGKTLVLKHLREVLKKYPNEQVARAVGLHQELEDDEDYHAGQIDGTPKSPWQPKEGIQGTHTYKKDGVRLKTTHAGDHLQVTGKIYTDEFDIAVPFDFKLYKTGEVSPNNKITMKCLFPENRSEPVMRTGAHFRRTLKEAFSIHPHVEEFKKAISKF